MTPIIFIFIINIFICVAYDNYENSGTKIFLNALMPYRSFKVFPGKPLTIVLNKYRYCPCRCYYSEGHLFLPIVPVKNHDQQYKVEKQNVTDVIFGDWSCERTVTGHNITFKIENAIEVNKQPHPKIMVNHMILPTLQIYNLTDTPTYVAEYHYENNEIMQVYCISTEDKCTVQMGNDLPGNKYASISITANRRYLTDIICTYTCKNSLYSIIRNVTLKFKEFTTETISGDLKINGNKLNLIFSTYNYAFYYAYFVHERIINFEFISKYTNMSITFDLYNKNNERLERYRSMNKLIVDIDPRFVARIELRYSFDQAVQNIRSFYLKPIFINEIEQMVIVNHQVLPLRKESNRNFVTEYYYTKNETIVVYCLNLTDTCAIQYSYNKETSDGHHNKGLIISQPELHSADILCQCSRNQHSLIKIQLRESIEIDYLLYINGKRLERNVAIKQVIYYFYGYFVNEETLKVNFTTINGIIYQVYSSDYRYSYNTDAKKSVNFTVRPQVNNYFYISIYVNNEKWLINVTCLPIHLDESKIVAPTITISTITEVIPVVTRSDPTPTQLTSSTSINELLETVPSNLNDDNWKEGLKNAAILLAAGIVMVICFAIVTRYLYRAYKRSRLIQSGDHDNYLNNNDDTAIPTYPPQWEINHIATATVADSDLYATVDSPYENTIMKRLMDESKRMYVNDKNQEEENYAEIQSELVYADICHGEANHVNNEIPKSTAASNKRKQITDLYAQVLPKRERHKKTNNENYVNIGNRTNAEPTYSEIIKH